MALDPRIVIAIEDHASRPFGLARSKAASLMWAQIVAHQRRRLVGLAAEWRAIARAMGVADVDATRG